MYMRHPGNREFAAGQMCDGSNVARSRARIGVGRLPLLQIPGVANEQRESSTTAGIGQMTEEGA